ncbi:type II secretion system protein GspM [Nitrospirillum pindoramense]|uniref:Type II secretion system (T2SS) protein M subtype b n=1 Tax=Nitrospirillum amazonense TaxID=28077 RepID=A0A560HLE8_9PROT|nr:type II secretion system protein GspM [Nitrospirillum amazonense]TWB45980.1 type II secretion system (T2SS) protein M subtype b [Nitrospirillum amazonense]
MTAPLSPRRSSPPRGLRPGFVLAIALCLLALPPYFYLAPLVDGVEAAAARRAARLAQLAATRALLAQQDDLARRAAQVDQALGVHTLLRTGVDAAAVQADAEGDVRGALRQAGVTINTLTARPDAGQGTYRRIHLAVSAQGDAVTVANALAALDGVRPRLLVRSARLRTDAPEPVVPGPGFGRAARGSAAGEANSVTLDIEIDAYADLAGP